MTEAIAALAELPEAMWMAVNVSGSQLTPDTATGWLQKLQQAGVEPGRLALELLERSLLRAPAAGLAGIEVLADAGVRVFFDDFGSGSAPLSSLHRFRVTGVRWIALHSSPHRPRCAGGPGRRRAGDDGRRAGAGVHRRGVESPEQAEALRLTGWTYAQGATSAHRGRPPCRSQGLTRRTDDGRHRDLLARQRPAARCGGGAGAGRARAGPAAHPGDGMRRLPHGSAVDDRRSARASAAGRARASGGRTRDRGGGRCRRLAGGRQSRTDLAGVGLRRVQVLPAWGGEPCALGAEFTGWDVDGGYADGSSPRPRSPTASATSMASMTPQWRRCCAAA